MINHAAVTEENIKSRYNVAWGRTVPTIEFWHTWDKEGLHSANDESDEPSVSQRGKSKLTISQAIAKNKKLDEAQKLFLHRAFASMANEREKSRCAPLLRKLGQDQFFALKLLMAEYSRTPHSLMNVMGVVLEFLVDVCPDASVALLEYVASNAMLEYSNDPTVAALPTTNRAISYRVVSEREGGRFSARTFGALWWARINLDSTNKKEPLLPLLLSASLPESDASFHSQSGMVLNEQDEALLAVLLDDVLADRDGFERDVPEIFSMNANDLAVYAFLYHKARLHAPRVFEDSGKSLSRITVMESVRPYMGSMANNFAVKSIWEKAERMNHIFGLKA